MPTQRLSSPNPKKSPQLQARDEDGTRKVNVSLVLAKIDWSGDCWLWTASTKANGYGQFHDGTRNWNAHRLVYILAGNPIGEGLELDHLCRVRHCVNPEHLEPVTREVNVRRQADTITHCPQGHAYDESNTYVHRGNRGCRTCRILRSSQRRRKLRGKA